MGALFGGKLITKFGTQSVKADGQLSGSRLEAIIEHAAGMGCEQGKSQIVDEMANLAIIDYHTGWDGDAGKKINEVCLAMHCSRNYDLGGRLRSRQSALSVVLRRLRAVRPGNASRLLQI